MNVTSFYPMYGTQDVAAALQFFEKLGFHKKHYIETEFAQICVLENAAAMHIDVINSAMVHKEGFFGIRMNVPDLQEAIAFFQENGARQLTPIVGHSASELVYFRTKNDDIYCVSHHIRKEVNP